MADIDIGKISEALNNKTDLDFNNMNPSDLSKDTIVGWGIPDYSAGVDITWTNETKNITIPSGTVLSSQAYFIAPSDGFVVLHASVSNGAEYVLVNENVVENPGTNVYVNARFPVSKGDEIRVVTVSRYYNCQFFPFKGVN